jgi:hypothetical protein
LYRGNRCCATEHAPNILRVATQPDHRSACRTLCDCRFRMSHGADPIGVRAAFVVWVDRISASEFEETNEIFEPPGRFDVHLREGTIPDWVAVVLNRLGDCCTVR